MLPLSRNPVYVVGSTPRTQTVAATLSTQHSIHDPAIISLNVEASAQYYYYVPVVLCSAAASVNLPKDTD